MLTLKEAIKALNKEVPDHTVTDAIDYDKKLYVFAAVVDPSQKDYNCPYYSVNKITGEVMNFNPMFDLPKFTMAAYKRKLTIPK